MCIQPSYLWYNVYMTQPAYSYDDVENAINASVSITETLQHLGMKVNSGNYHHIRKIAAAYNLELPSWVNRPKFSQTVVRLTDKEFFVNGVTHAGTDLRRRLIATGRAYTCENTKCILHGKSEWNGEKLVFQVDHISGDKFDNRVENLQFLCPNCHSQTPTFSRNSSKLYTYCVCGRRMHGDIVEDFCVHSADGSWKSLFCADCDARLKDKNAVRCTSCETKKRVESGSGLKIVWPEVSEIVAHVEQLGFTAYGKSLGVSGNAVKKRLVALKVHPLPKKLSKSSR